MQLVHLRSLRVFTSSTQFTWLLFCYILMWILAYEIPVLWLQWTSSHGLPSPVEEKGLHGHSLKGRALPWQTFIAFLGILHWGWSSFRWLQKTKERVLLITSKRKDISNVKRKVVELVTLTFGRFSIDFRRLLWSYPVNFCCLNSGWGSFSKKQVSE